VDNFIEEVKQYLCLNSDVAGYNLPIKKVTFTLTLIKGPETAGWVKDIGNAIDQLNPVTQNVDAVWDTFLDKFLDCFQDTQSEVRACQELKHLKLQTMEVNQYITKFEELACKSRYSTGNAKIYELFLEGLPHDILKDVMALPIPQDYAELKQKAVNIVRSMVLMSNILKGRGEQRTITRLFNQGNKLYF